MRGHFLIGDPCMEDVSKWGGSNLKPLTYTKKEVEMIGDVSKMHLPREKRQLTSEEFLNWPPSVALIHIAAHGNR